MSLHILGMSDGATGVGLSVFTAVIWGISPVFMASVGRRIGSQNTNFLRSVLAALGLALVVLPVHRLISGHVAAPRMAQVAWLVASGTVGMVIGDACYYEALVLLGPRRAVKINTLAPVVGVLVGWLALNETLAPTALAGCVLVIGAVMYATFANTAAPGTVSKEPGHMSAIGLICGLISAACIGLGSVLGRKAFKVDPDLPLDPIMATVIRVGCAAVMISAITLYRRQFRVSLTSLNDATVRSRLAIGTLMGPLVGMITFVSALKYSDAGVVSTIISASPLVILPVVAIQYRVRIRTGIVIAGIVAVVGVWLISRKPA
jgi:drug/metabolite transporter (DMT)-like permease